MSNSTKTAPAMVPETFSDGVANILLYQGVVRLELTRVVSGSNGKSNVPVPVVTQTVVMPLEGFLKSYEGMQAFFQQLVQTGVVAKKQAQATEGPSGHGQADEAAGAVTPPQSPNFA